MPQTQDQVKTQETARRIIRIFADDPGLLLGAISPVASDRRQADEELVPKIAAILDETREAGPDLLTQPSGADLIAAERKRQVEAEGWTPEHDDGHENGELVQAARVYLDPSAFMRRGRLGDTAVLSDSGVWPWDAEWWKPSPDPIRNLVKAGALIAAEIDRLQRAK